MTRAARRKKALDQRGAAAVIDAPTTTSTSFDGPLIPDTFLPRTRTK